MIDAQSRYLALTCKQAVCEDCARRQTRFTEWIITIFSNDVPAGIGDDAGRTEVVFQDVDSVLLIRIALIIWGDTIGCKKHFASAV